MLFLCQVRQGRLQAYVHVRFLLGVTGESKGVGNEKKNENKMA